MEIRFKQIIVLSILVVFSGCSNLQWPPPGQVRAPRTAKSIAVMTQRFVIPASGIIQVRKGDTIFILSRRYGVSARAIIEANDLIPPYRLEPAESLILPRPVVHQIISGDSLYKISQAYGVDAYELARLNYLQPPYRIYVGNKLLLPSSGKIDVVDKINMLKRQSGKNSKLFSIKKRAASIPEIPAPSRELASKIYQPKKNKKLSTGSNQKTISVPRVKTSGLFTWPVRGRLLSLFGSKGDGLHNDGINIVAPRGAKVKAAGSGVVAYAGNQLPGFGNLLLIKHSGGWVTAYAHNGSLLVKRGDKVDKGQVVAKVGASGNVVAPQLHFEVRKGKKAINPLRHLKRLDAMRIKGPEKIVALTY